MTVTQDSPKERIHEFFAVTETSIYHVSDGTGMAVAQKIALHDASAIGAGQILGGGTMVAICKCLIAYIPEGGGITSYERRIEMVNTRWWGGNSSPIIGLFKNKEDAYECFAEKSQKSCDPRWQAQTLEVLREIGEDHPHFSICHYPALALPIVSLL